MGVQPTVLSDFETQARRLRYQALGMACRDRQIRALLLAHHEDDQAECVLARLAQGHRGTGLLGMQPVTDIPECQGIYGVHRSGAADISKRKRIKYHHPSGSLNAELAWNQAAQSAMVFESGGVRLCRPFLRFSKARLEATCRAEHVRWIEDKTNSDPTMTPRNAIRQLLRNGSLPRSLQKPSLLALRDSMSAKLKSRDASARSLIATCDVSRLDTHSGVLCLRLRSRPLFSSSTPLTNRHQRLVDAEYQAALMLRQLLGMVTPLENVSLDSLQFAAKTLFPEINVDNPSKNPNRPAQISGFTAAGVSFQRVPSSSRRPHDLQHVQASDSLDAEFIWRLAREPFRSEEKPPLVHIDPASSALDLDTSLSPSLRTISPPPPPFCLWDNRYWFRVHNPTPFPLIIRPLCEKDLVELRASLSPRPRHALNELLHVAAPGKVRWTLPVIARVRANGAHGQRGKGEEREENQGAGGQEGGGGEEKEEEELLALPTLPWKMRMRDTMVSWEVRYKQVPMQGISAKKLDLRD